jgi:aldehyde dehydrogenase (NAD+)
MGQTSLETTNEISRDRISVIVQHLVQQQKDFFNTGVTKDIAFRIAQLQKLRQAIEAHQDAVLQAVKTDLNKPAVEAYLTEMGGLREIEFAIKHLRSWTSPKKVSLPFSQLPAKGRICAEPLGTVLIIAPWNYPFYLMIAPLVGAIAAGNCALLKPSELAPATSQLIASLIKQTFEPNYIAVLEGGVEVSQAVLAEKFDHIFFTGSTAIGKLVMQAAAQHLTPVTLELGGKSPCIVDAEVNIDYAAKRIAWGKFVNAGQTCIAPDYLLVDRRIKSALLEALKAAIHQFYGDDPATSPDYARIINPKQFTRAVNLLNGSTVVAGGQTIAAERYIAPTVLDQVSWDDPVMQEEIFAPILPVLEYDSLEEAIAQINARPKPLALYIFSKNLQIQRQVLQQTSSGGVCVNDTIMQIASSTLPFGGVGASGMGRYHGKASFDTFSHFKSVLYKPFWIDLPLRYAPYAGKMGLLKRLMS